MAGLHFQPFVYEIIPYQQYSAAANAEKNDLPLIAVEQSGTGLKWKVWMSANRKR